VKNDHLTGLTVDDLGNVYACGSVDGEAYADSFTMKINNPDE
jgi:hypothetical protein